MVNKAESSFQQYELLNYEIGIIKKTLLEIGGKITLKLLNNALIIQNPNEAIYLLIKMFYKIISSIQNNEKFNNNIKWEILQKKCTYSIFTQYIKVTSEIFHKSLNKDDLDEAMPFLVNYEKLEEILKKFGNEYLLILEFIKINVDYNIKLNIIQNLYNGNLNKNNKINTLQTEVNNLNNLLEKSKELYESMDKELIKLKSLNLKIRNWNKNNKIFVLNLLIKYNLCEQYNIIYEFSQISDKEKYIIKLKSNFKNRENFLNFLFENKKQYLKGTSKKLNQTIINYLFENNKTRGIISIEKQRLKYFKPKFLSQNFTKINNSLTSRENSETNTQSKSKIKALSSINTAQIQTQNTSGEKTTGRTKNEKDNYKYTNFMNNNIIESFPTLHDNHYDINLTERKSNKQKQSPTLILEKNEVDFNCLYCYRSLYDD